jgi:hypothetical protein
MALIVKSYVFLGEPRHHLEPYGMMTREPGDVVALLTNIARSIVILYISLCLYSHTAHSQTTPDDIITFDRIKLSLGMPQRTVMTALAPEYNLVHVGGGVLWDVQTKSGESVGSLRFEDGKLVIIQKRWGTQKQKGLY